MWQGNWPPPHLSERPFRSCRAEFLRLTDSAARTNVMLFIHRIARPSGIPWLWSPATTVPWSVPAFPARQNLDGRPRSFGEVGVPVPVPSRVWGGR